MTTDPVVGEFHRLRAEQMARFNFDFEAFYRDLKEQEKLSPEPVQSPPGSPRKDRVHRTAGPMIRRRCTEAD